MVSATAPGVPVPGASVPGAVAAICRSGRRTNPVPAAGSGSAPGFATPRPGRPAKAVYVVYVAQPGKAAGAVTAAPSATVPGAWCIARRWTRRGASRGVQV